MSKINLANKGFQFFLASSTQVESLEVGAKTHGGATKFGNVIKSNIMSGDFVEITNKNVLRVFVPSTVNVNGSASFAIVQENLNLVKTVFERMYLADGSGSNLTVAETKGSWYSDDNKCVVVEDIYIVSIDVEAVSNEDVLVLKSIAQRIKKAMSQEGVSIMINEALAIA